MTPLLRHLQLCERPFDDLEGDDLVTRRCGRCDVVVHNFDNMLRRDREELLRRSDRERTVCAGTNMPVAAAPGCRERPDLLALLLLATFPRMLLVAILLGLPLLAVVLAWLNHLDATRQPRSPEPLAEWGDAWQHGFFTALEARLAPTTRLYR